MASVQQRARIGGRLVLLVAAALLVSNGVWIARNVDALRPIGAGDLAPGFSLPSIDAAGQLGPPRSLAALRGKVVLIDFWAEWCGPCRRSMPVLEQLYRRHRDRGFTVLSVNTDGPEGAAKARRTVPNTTFPLVSDDGHVADLYKVTTIPHLLLVDQRGVVRHVHRGFAGEKALARSLDAQVTSLLDAVP